MQIAVFLIVKLGLWVPVLFATGWLFICLFNHIPLSDPKAVNVLVVGLIVSAAAGVAGTSYFRYQKREKKRRAKEAQKNAKKEAKIGNRQEKEKKYTGSRNAGRAKNKADGRQWTEDRSIEEPDAKNDERGLEANRQDAAQDSRGYRAPEAPCPPPPPPNPTYDAEYERKYFPSAESLSPAEDRQTNEGAAAAPCPRPPRMPPQPQDETPLVFATRKDPNIFIAEYSDRLVFFKKLKNGETELIATEFKK